MGMLRLPLLALAAALVAPALLPSSADAQRGWRQGRDSMRAPMRARMVRTTRTVRNNGNVTTTRTVRRDGRSTTTTVRTDRRHRRYRNHHRVVVGPQYAPPPRPRHARRHRAHRRGVVWIPGHWTWDVDCYVWEPGRWVPRRHARHYQPGRWVLQGNQYVWIEGRWERNRDRRDRRRRRGQRYY